MAKTIVRRDKSKEKPFTIISNTVVRDHTISFRARGLLVYLLSMPDDWAIYLSELENHSDHDGRESISTAMDELREHGYISLTDDRDAKGRITAWVYAVHEEPVEVDKDVLDKLEKKRKNKKTREERKRENKLIKQVINPETGFPFLGQPETGSPEVETPEVVNPQLLNTNINKQLTKQNINKKQQQTESMPTENPVVDTNSSTLGIPQQTQEVIIDKEPENTIAKQLTDLNIKPNKTEIKRWIHTYGSNYVLEKITIVQKQSSATPLKTLRAAIRDNWLANIEPNKENDSKAISEHLNDIVSVQHGKYERFYQLYAQAKAKS